MKNRFWLLQRRGIYYAEDSQTRKRESLRTSNKAAAQRILAAKNESVSNVALNLHLGRIYLAAHDPKLVCRTWAEVIEELCSHGKEQSQERYRREFNSGRFNPIRDRHIVETTGDELRAVLALGGAATNNFLHRLHNLAINMGWLPFPIIPPKQWPKVKGSQKRGVRLEEYQAIIAAEKNEERGLYYQMLWETGAAQSDAAKFSAANVDRRTDTFSYVRSKTGEVARLRLGQRLKALLERLPGAGPFFPRISTLSDSDRSAEFSRRCRLLGINGVSLHSFRYSWAERALASGYPERFAQAALGHKSRAVHQAYARGGDAICPSLEAFEEKIVPFGPPATNCAVA